MLVQLFFCVRMNVYTFPLLVVSREMDLNMAACCFQIISYVVLPV